MDEKFSGSRNQKTCGIRFASRCYIFAEQGLFIDSIVLIM